nr:4-hydroxyacetophenone monooxygenase [Micromonospora sp. DSM 115978]
MIFGTGFRVGDLPIAGRIHGSDGRSLAATWRRGGGMQALRGTTVAGFPNLFFVVGPNTGLGHTSMVYMIESQLNYVTDALAAMTEHHIASLEPRPWSQHVWNERLQRRMRRTVWS